jgi:uncharacterized protein YutE (UPF0331/DUF86 family)
MIDDIVLNKKERIERCILQIKKYYALNQECLFEEDFFKQDAIGINLQRLCELTIDLANHIVKKYKLGLPKESKTSFEILTHEKIIPEDLAKEMIGMIGFRNILVHEYQKVDLRIMKAIIENHLDDFVSFTNCLLKFNPEDK